MLELWIESESEYISSNVSSTKYSEMVIFIILKWYLLREFVFYMRNDYSYCESCRENY